jgi:hypothetical protein
MQNRIRSTMTLQVKSNLLTNRKRTMRSKVRSKKTNSGSRKNGKQRPDTLATIFDIAHIETKGDIIGQMRGMLKGYSDATIDSIELVRAVREEL